MIEFTDLFSLLDVPNETKEDISTSVTKLQVKLEQKRQRKLEKKLAKQQEQAAQENTVKEGVDVNEGQEKRIKKAKVRFIVDIRILIQETNCNLFLASL